MAVKVVHLDISSAEWAHLCIMQFLPCRELLSDSFYGQERGRLELSTIIFHHSPFIHRSSAKQYCSSSERLSRLIFSVFA